MAKYRPPHLTREKKSGAGDEDKGSNKLCYILPKYDESSSEHYYHIYELLEELSQQIEIYLIIEKTTSTPKFNRIKHIFIQRFSFLPLRLIENLVICLYCRLKGCRTYYSHYSTIGSINSSIVTKIFGGTSFFWNCGLKKEFMIKKLKLTFPILKQILLFDWPFLLSLKLSDYLVTGTPSMARYYSHNFGKRLEEIIIIPQWVNVFRFKKKGFDQTKIKKLLGIDIDTTVILFVHWLSERKGVQYIPEIAENIIREIPSVVFVVVGTGPYKQKLSKELDERKLKGLVMLLGEIPNSVLPKYFAIADVFINPSLEEGFPRVLLECMAMEVPFVATDVGGVIDYLSPTQREYLVPSKDTQAFSKKLVSLLLNQDTQKELVKEGLQTIRKFTMEKSVERFLAIFKRE